MNNLRAHRTKQLLTQRQLAKKAGVSTVTISFIENQLSSPTDLTKQKLVRALAVDLEELFPQKPKKSGLRR